MDAVAAAEIRFSAWKEVAAAAEQYSVRPKWMLWQLLKFAP